MAIIVTNKDFPKASEYIYNKYFKNSKYIYNKYCKSFDENTNNVESIDKNESIDENETEELTAMLAALLALEKEIPKEMKEEILYNPSLDDEYDEFQTFVCPSCKNPDVNTVIYRYDYCPHCGQRLKQDVKYKFEAIEKDKEDNKETIE